MSGTYVDQLWNTYTSTVNGGPDPRIPYLALIRNKLRDVFPDGIDVDGSAECLSVVRNKLNYPCLMELIWSYWHEEGMLVQSMNAITRRFQNIRGPETRSAGGPGDRPAAAGSTTSCGATSRTSSTG